MVPSTNNGNEGQNSWFKEEFGIHPKIWDFFLTVDDELQSVNADIPQIIFGALVPKPDERYAANFEAGLQIYR